MDISLALTPKLIDNQANSVLEYLRLTDKDKIFATEILKLLVEDRCIAHHDRINNNRNIVALQQGDVVMARREVFSDKAKHRVSKLQYQVSGHFVITRATGHGSYFARRL